MGDYLENITNYLFSQSWQLILLIIVIAPVSWILKNRSAHIRYLLWLIVIGKCLIPPLFTVPLAILPQEESVEQPSVSQPIESAMLFDTSNVMETESVEIPMTSTEIMPVRSVENNPTQSSAVSS